MTYHPKKAEIVMQYMHKIGFVGSLNNKAFHMICSDPGRTLFKPGSLLGAFVIIRATRYSLNIFTGGS